MRERLPAREVNELLKLDDDALVDTREAAAVLAFSANTLVFYRKRRLEASPKFQHVGLRAIRYRMGDLRAFRNGDPSAYHVPRTAEG